jgi:hypothetical protein
MGASAAAPNQPRALRALVATEPRASRIGLSSMSRVSSTVRSVVGASKPGVMSGTTSGAASASTTPSASNASSITFAIEDTSRHPRSSSPWAMRPDTIGIRAEPSAPAATSWNMRSGSR